MSGGKETDPVPFEHLEVAAGGGTVHVVEAGDPTGQPYVFLHGWPQSWRAWESVMQLAGADGACAIALDLPGIGGSASAATDGTARDLAAVVREALMELEVDRPVIVGHDAGGHVAYAYLREHPEDVRAAVLMSIVIPGLEPWDQVLANPYIWHFAFHQVAELPEALVAGKELPYFRWFYDALMANRSAITPELEAEYAEAYATPTTLKAGFDLYRGFRQDAADNSAPEFRTELAVPLLYLRGDQEPGDLAAYERGFTDAGLTDVTTALVEGAGHFTPEESPASAWARIHEWSAVPAR